jgi:pimeloyl-ACP methyl ester carboxylesterase
MRLERTASMIGMLALVVSAGNAHLRRVEETRRRQSSPSIGMHRDSAGGRVEYAVSRPENESQPVIVFETGLGASMDTWDWLVQMLADDYWLVRYHRRGHGRTRTSLRPGAIVTELLREIGAEDRALHLVGHSLGGLVIANALNEFPSLVEKVHSVTMIDATDGELLDAERDDPAKVRQFRQSCLQEGLASVTGLSRWTVSPVEAEVNFRAATQRAFLTESSRPRTLRTAVREHAGEPTAGQSILGRLTCRKTVIAAGDNVIQQRRLAEKIGARLVVVPGTSHRAIIGRYAPAAVVADVIREISA